MYSHILQMPPASQLSQINSLLKSHPGMLSNPTPLQTAQAQELIRLRKQVQAQQAAASSVKTTATAATTAKSGATTTALAVKSATPATTTALTTATAGAKKTTGGLLAGIKTGAAAGAKKGIFGGPKGMVAGLAIGAIGGGIFGAVQNRRNSGQVMAAAPEAPMFGPGTGFNAGGAYSGATAGFVGGAAVGMATGMVGQNAEIDELRRQLQIWMAERERIHREMVAIGDRLTEMSVTISANSDMGRALNNLSNQSIELARQTVADLDAIINFLEERINFALRGIADSTSTISSLTNEMSSVNWFAA